MKNRKIAMSLIFIFLLLIPTTSPKIMPSENSNIAKSTFTPQINITKPVDGIYLNNKTIITWGFSRTIDILMQFFGFGYYMLKIYYFIVTPRIIGDILIETEVNIPTSEIDYVEFSIINYNNIPFPVEDYVIVEKDYTWPYSFYWDYHPRVKSDPEIIVSVVNNSGKVIAKDYCYPIRIN